MFRKYTKQVLLRSVGGPSAPIICPSVSRLAKHEPMRLTTFNKHQFSANLHIKITKMSESQGTSTSGTAGNHDRSRCLFCRICDENEKTKLVYKDENIVAFTDIRPAAKYHFLIVPREHIRDAKTLDGSLAHTQLLDCLVKIGNKVFVDAIEVDKSTANANGNTSDSVSKSEKRVASTDPPKALMGFHWPPFHTVSHLHLHVIGPSDSIGFIGRMIFRENSFWFVSPDWVKDRMKKLKQ